MSRTLSKLAVAAAVAGVCTSLFTGREAQAQTVVFGVAAPAVSVQIRLAPPPLPVYAQPPCPVAGYLWTPGYWAYGPTGYYWVPGTWVAPPAVGMLWTPGYWGWSGGVFLWHAGYWGPHVGFYGGVNYGFGYGGMGYYGGRWEGGRFAYNAAVSRVNFNVIHNTYRQTVVNNMRGDHVSFNGGPGGLRVAPSMQERMAARDRHLAPTPLQRQHVQLAERTPGLAARANGGHPGRMAATERAAQFHAAGARPPGRGQERMQPRTREAPRNQQFQRPQAEHRQAERPQPGHSQGGRQQFERQPQARPQQREPQAHPQPRPQAQQQHQQHQQPRREEPQDRGDRDRR